MSYTGSKAQIGLGAVLAIGPLSGTSSPTYVPIFELRKTDLSAEYSKITRTNFQSTMAEYGQGILDGGTVSLSGARVSSDAGQAALLAAFNNRGAYLFTLTYPKTPTQTTLGDVESFTALVMKFGKSVDPDGDIMITVDLQITNIDTLVLGT